MKSSCPLCSERYSSSENFDRHLRTIHALTVYDLLSNQYSLLQCDQPAQTPNNTDESPESIPDSYSDIHYASESNSLNEDCGNNSDIESETYFLMIEADGDATGQKVSTTVYKYAGEPLYRSEN
ncbi:hypothetical protein DFP73DRAFT_598332 [Morchella snyderi]|nr:hypothetical protein DFP73DRAFT_598332 [Morchella snyderi]